MTSGELQTHFDPKTSPIESSAPYMYDEDSEIAVFCHSALSYPGCTAIRATPENEMCIDIMWYNTYNEHREKAVGMENFSAKYYETTDGT